MSRVIAAIAPERTRKNTPSDPDCPVQVRAELVSLGGAVLLGMCLIISAIFFMVMMASSVTSVQKAIAVILFIGSWAYFWNSVTERLSFVGNVLTFTSALNKSRNVPLEELEAVILRHEGLNLERGIETIELHRDDHPPDMISLGPCWQHRKLEAFLRSLESAMHATATFFS